MHNLSLGGGAGEKKSQNGTLFHPIFLASAGESFAAGV